MGTPEKNIKLSPKTGEDPNANATVWEPAARSLLVAVAMPS